MAVLSSYNRSMLHCIRKYYLKVNTSHKCTVHFCFMICSKAHLLPPLQGLCCNQSQESLATPNLPVNFFISKKSEVDKNARWSKSINKYLIFGLIFLICLFQGTKYVSVMNFLSTSLIRIAVSTARTDIPGLQKAGRK